MIELDHLAAKEIAADRPSSGALAAKALCALVGFAAVLGQIVLMRELLAVFHGNELSLGILLAMWLFWTAAGSAFLRRTLPQPAHLRAAAARGLVICGTSLPCTLWMVRGSRAWFTPVPGEVLGPLPMLLIAASSTCVFCVASGAMFAVASRMLAQALPAGPNAAPAYAYLLETAGAAAGGLLTSLVLLKAFGSFQIAAVVWIIELCAAAALTLRGRLFWRVALAPVGFLIMFLLLYGVAPYLERIATQRQWDGVHVLYAQNSLYGRMVVTDTGGMRSIYDNGAILANIPDKAAAEESVHLVLLEHPAPKKILLLGGGMNGSIAEALRHPSLQRVDVVELDPTLPVLYQHLFPAEAQRSFADPRVHLFSGDGRAFLSATRETYDAILVHVPDPDTAQWNRFYTTEFFRIASQHLLPNGILALQLRGFAEALSPQMAQLLHCIRSTLQSVFAHVVLIPGDPVHFVAAQADVLTEDPRILVERMQNRALRTTYIRESFLPFRMSPDRMAQIHEILQAKATTPMLNRDFRPQAYYFGMVVWSSQFRSAHVRGLQAITQIPFGTLMLPLCLLLAALVIGLGWPARSGVRPRIPARWSLLAAGYVLMTTQVLILLAFQSLCGYLFYELALLIGMLMGGLSLGTWLGMRLARHANLSRLTRVSWINQLCMAASAPAFLLLVSLLAQVSLTAPYPAVLECGFALLAVLCGIPGGMQFPLAAVLCSIGNQNETTSAGAFYALDLLGGCAGAVLLTGLVIPLYGFWNAAWLACIVSLAPALLTALLPDQGMRPRVFSLARK